MHAAVQAAFLALSPIHEEVARHLAGRRATSEAVLVDDAFQRPLARLVGLMQAMLGSVLRGLRVP